MADRPPPAAGAAATCLHLLLLLLTLHAPVAVVQGQQQVATTWNHVIDNLVSQFRQQVYEQGKDMVRLPPLRAHVLSRHLGGRVEVKLDADGGAVGPLTSVHRAGDVTVDPHTDAPLLAVRLRFARLRLHYEHFYLRALAVGPRGKLDADVEGAEFTLRARVHPEPPEGGGGCTMEYVDVHTLSLGKVDVSVRGLKLFNWLGSAVGTRLAKNMRTTMQGSLERLLAAELRDIFSRAILDCRGAFGTSEGETMGER